MKYRSVFDIIGPVMIGPSSSHTAGAVRIGQLARKLFGQQPTSAVIHFLGSFAKTYKGHATDVAVLAGLLDLAPDDDRIPSVFMLADSLGLRYEFIPESAVPAHPNTVMIEMSAGNKSMQITGISIGGGLVQIVSVDAFPLHLSGENPALLIFHKDQYGTIAGITQSIADTHTNISRMEVSRAEKGCSALMVIETDAPIDQQVVDAMEKHQNIDKIIRLDL